MQTTSSLDVTEATIRPSFRSTPWAAEGHEDSNRQVARIVFVSESNVCRSVLAGELMMRLLDTSPLADLVAVESRVSFTSSYTFNHRLWLSLSAEISFHYFKAAVWTTRSLFFMSKRKQQRLNVKITIIKREEDKNNVMIEPSSDDVLLAESW